MERDAFEKRGYQQKDCRKIKLNKEVIWRIK